MRKNFWPKTLKPRNTPGRTRDRCEDNNNIALKETHLEVMEWIQLTQDRD
jgi:hypothetical protein